MQVCAAGCQFLDSHVTITWGSSRVIYPKRGGLSNLWDKNREFGIILNLVSVIVIGMWKVFLL